MARQLPRILAWLREHEPPSLAAPAATLVKSAEAVEHEARRSEATALRTCLESRRRALETRRRDAAAGATAPATAPTQPERAPMQRQPLKADPAGWLACSAPQRCSERGRQRNGWHRRRWR